MSERVDRMVEDRRVSRRGAIGLAAAGVAVAAGARAGFAADAAEGHAALAGRIKQSVCKWCFDGKVPFEKLCAEAAKMGIGGVDLVDVKDWPTLKKYNLVGTMSNSHPIDPGLNRKENHEKFVAAIRKSIEQTAEAGFPNVICFSGNRKGMDDQEGIKNCAEALKQVVGLAEEKKVTVCMELLNSKVNHKDYMCDHTPWGVELCKTVGSDRFKLLYDIYHMQIMEGDVIATVKKYKDYIGHYHTAGVPGRHEIDDTQELNYPGIVKAIIDTGYKGWLGQEFIPVREPIASLAQAVKTCDV